MLLDEVTKRLSACGRSCDDLLLAADLDLSLGEVAGAKARLAQLASQPAPQPIRDKAVRLSREVLYQELAAKPEESDAILGELERLSQTPRQRGRYLQARVVADITRGNLDAAIAASCEFASLGIAEMVPSASDSTHLLSPRSWLASTDLLVRKRFEGPVLEHLQARVASEMHRILPLRDRGDLEKFLAVYGNWPEADEVRLRLAQLLAAAGEPQQAELLLIEAQKTGRPKTVDAATRQLAHLWDRAGFPEEAAELLVDMKDANLQAAAVEEFPATSLTRIACRRLKDAEKPVGRTRVTQTMWEHCDSRLADTYANAARPFVMRPSSPFQLIERGSSMHADISIVDRFTGMIAGRLNVPAPYAGSTLALTSQVGHFLPLGSRSSLHGISLLHFDRERPLWSTSPAAIVHDQDAAYVGPSGPTFCVFQSHRHLFVLDPGTGKMLWHRTDLDPNSGLAGDTLRGIFGDDQVLVVLGPDKLDYTLYRTATGEELRQGRLDSDSHHTHERRTFGRFLLHFTSDEPNRRMRIWDPATDRLLYDRPISDRQLWKETSEDEVAVVDGEGNLQIVDGFSGNVRVSIPLDPALVRGTSQLVAFRDSTHYYVNLQPIQPVPEPRRYSYCFGSDTTLPRVDLAGTLLAIERKTGRLLWNRSFPHRTLVRSPTLRMPMLIMLSSVGDHTDSSQCSMLVEVVDSNTGETLGIEDNHFSNRILQLTYEPESRRVRLWGTRSVVNLDFTDREHVPEASASK